MFENCSGFLLKNAPGKNTNLQNSSSFTICYRCYHWSKICGTLFCVSIHDHKLSITPGISAFSRTTCELDAVAFKNTPTGTHSYWQFNDLRRNPPNFFRARFWGRTAGRTAGTATQNPARGPDQGALFHRRKNKDNAYLRVRLSSILDREKSQINTVSLPEKVPLQIHVHAEHGSPKKVTWGIAPNLRLK